jgi:site-specific DNA-methyltransferase (adenine-specific)
VTEAGTPLAKVEASRKEREKRRLAQLRAAALGAPEDDPRWRVVTGDCVEQLAAVERGSARLIFADPPYNIGIDYGEGEGADRLPGGRFASWLGEWIAACRDVLTDDGSLWVLISDEFAAEAVVSLKRAGFTMRNWVKWFEGFGTNCKSKFGRCTRHLLHGVRDPQRHVFHAEVVRVPSARQTVYGDARANPAGKVMPDLWDDIPRLAGTHGERIPSFPTQLPVALVARVVAAASDPGDLVIDPFNGSGTTGEACLRLGRRYLGVETSERFAELARLRLRGVCNHLAAEGGVA